MYNCIRMASSEVTEARGPPEAMAGLDEAEKESEETAKEEKVESEKKSDHYEDPATRAFECNICLDTASDAVISMCGHLFCWPCLHQWLETRPQRQICPVCKAGIGRYINRIFVV